MLMDRPFQVNKGSDSRVGPDDSDGVGLASVSRGGSGAVGVAPGPVADGSAGAGLEARFGSLGGGVSGDLDEGASDSLIIGHRLESRRHGSNLTFRAVGGKIGIQGSHRPPSIGINRVGGRHCRDFIMQVYAG